MTPRGLIGDERREEIRAMLDRLAAAEPKPAMTTDEQQFAADLRRRFLPMTVAELKLLEGILARIKKP